MHDALAALEHGHSDAEAIQLAWNTWGHMLAPSDLDLLKLDLETFHRRDPRNVRTVLCEDEIRVPLILADGELAYFRARIDRLYERLDRPGSFILIDYKSSRWAKSEGEVRGEDDDEADDAALQLWAYDWALHEYLPEIEDLLCIYDQLRYGQIPVRKSDQQRAQMRNWLVAQMSAFFADTDYQADGLLKPRKNKWCAWCPILESCPIIFELSHWALATIGAQGEQLPDAPALDSYAEEYDLAKSAMKVLDRFVKSMNGVVKELPHDEQARLGFRVGERKNSILTPEALARLKARLGEERFLELVSLPKTRLKSLDKELQEWAAELMVPAAPTQVISRKEPSR